MHRLYRLRSYFTNKNWYDIGFEACIYSILFLVPLVFSDGFYLSFEIPKTFIFRFFLYLAVFFFFYKAFFTNFEINGIFRSKMFVLLLFVAPILFLLSYTISIAPNVSFWGSYTRQQGLFSYIHYFVFFLLILLNANPKFLKKALWVSVLAFFVTLIIGLLQYLGIKFDNFNTDLFLGRIYSTFGNPTAFGSFISIMFFPSIYLFFHRRSVVLNGIGIGFVILVLSNLFMNGSRAPVVGIFAGGLFLLIAIGLNLKKKKIIFSASISILFLFVLFGLINVFGNVPIVKNTTLLNRFVLNTESLRSMETRLNMWPSNLNMIFDRPFLGYGPDTFSMAYSPYFNKDLLLTENLLDYPDRAHNIILQLLSDFGFFGLIVFIIACIYLFKFVFQERDEYLYLKLFLFSSFISLSSDHLFGFSSTEHLVFISFILAYLFSLNNFRTFRVSFGKLFGILIFTLVMFFEFLIVLPISLSIAKADMFFSSGISGLKSYDNTYLQLVVDAAQISPNHGFYDYSIGEIYYAAIDSGSIDMKKDRIDRALFFANIADVFFNKRDVRSKILLGKIYSKNFQYLNLTFSEAKNALDDAKKLAPNNPTVYLEYGKLWFYKNDYANAIESFEKYISLCPDVWRYKNDKLWLSVDRNSFKYRMFYKANPDFDDVFNFIYNSYNAIGNKSKSSYYKKFVKT